MEITGAASVSQNIGSEACDYELCARSNWWNCRSGDHVPAVCAGTSAARPVSSEHFSHQRTGGSDTGRQPEFPMAPASDRAIVALGIGPYCGVRSTELPTSRFTE